MNVLLLIADDLAPLLGCYGHPLAHTPNIDHLAASGLCFDHAYTPCALCSPARASLFTGLTPAHHGVLALSDRLRDRIDAGLVTWPALLRRHGWRSTRAGKVFHKGVPEGVALRQPGDDDPTAWDLALDPPGLELNCNGRRVDLTPWETHRAGTGGAIAWLEAEKGDEWHHDHQVARAIAQAIDDHDPAAGPALWAAGFARPHVPLVAPRRFFERYRARDVPLDPPPAGATPLPAPVRRRFGAGFGLDDDQRRDAIRAYLACVSFLDEQVGLILDALDRRGLADDTLVVFTADHGFQLGEHGLWFKHQLHRESVRIPLIVRDPRRAASAGRRRAALVSQEDLYPTLCAALGLAAPHALDGESLLPLLDDPAGELRPAVFHRCGGPDEGRAIRTREWCYAEWNGGEVRQLFDLTADPGEHVDLLHAGEGHPAARDLAARLEAAGN